MFSAPFTIRQPKEPMRLVTLGWPQFVAVALSLCLLAAGLTFVLLMPWISQAFYIYQVRQYEKDFGFEYGRLKGVPNEPMLGWEGFIRVTPGGAMDRAGFRSGDIIHSQYGRERQGLLGGLEAVTEGRTICFFVVNSAESHRSPGRTVCLDAKPREGPGSINPN
jgi:hypothetical protein